ncbi:hypothetical protein TNCV_4365091 [Trichonephila clavipes]|nr:hypothetical protein TNCV_4365091 [Trichonephila clavipes]
MRAYDFLLQKIHRILPGSNQQPWVNEAGILPLSHRVVLMLGYKATRGLLLTDLVILNLHQVRKSTTETAPLSSNYHITPMGGHEFSIDLTCIGLL